MAKIDYFVPRLWSDEIVKSFKANSIMKSLTTKGRITPSAVNGEILSWHTEFIRDASLVKKWYDEQGTPESEQVMPLTAEQRVRYRASSGDHIFGMRITARDEPTTG